MRSLVTWAVKNSPFMNTVLIAVLLIGALSMTRLQRETFPEFQLEIIVASVPYPGASPSEVEEAICQRIEESIRGIDGIKKITSVAGEGSGSVVAELRADVGDPQKILEEIRSAVDRIPSFPELAEDPNVQQITLRTPAINVGVLGGDSEDPENEWILRELAEEIRNDLLMIPSISQVSMTASKRYQIDVEIPEANLRKYGLTLRDVSDVIRRENIEIPAGSIKASNAEYLVRGKNKSLVGSEIAKLPVLTQPNGVVLTVGDLGTVRDGFEDTTALNEIDGQPGTVMVVQKSSNEDLLQITSDVRKYAKDKQMPAGYSIKVWGDLSVAVRDRLELLTRNGLFGLGLVFLVLSLFLDLRLAFWVALGIPVSILGTCIFMLYSGATLNMLSMFAFVMGLGIVVDDAIVISENVFSHRQRGKPLLKAAIDGTLEVAPSVTVSVMTTVIAFSPLLFVTGVMGKFMAVIPVAVISMLLISLVESMFILPCHLAHTPKMGETHSMLGRFHTFLQAPLKRLIEDVYMPGLRWCLDDLMLTFSGALAILLLALGLVLGGFTPFVVFPKIDNDFLRAQVAYPVGTPGARSDEATKRLVEAAHRVADEINRDYGEDVMNLVQRSVGQMTRESELRTVNNSNVGEVSVELVTAENRSITSDEFLRRWREAAGEFPGVEELGFASASIAPSGKPIEFKLLGNDVKIVEKAVEEVKAELATRAGVFDISDDAEPGKWELQLKIRPEAEAMGIQLDQLARTVRATYYGAEAMRLQRGRHELKLMVRYPPEERRSLANFEEIRIRTPQGDEIPLLELAQVTVDRGYSEINRINQVRSITVTADVDEKQANAREITVDLKRNYLPTLFEKYPGVGIRWEGHEERTQESVRSLFAGFIVAMFAMFALLTAEFRSYLQPLIILAVIPFGMIGAVFGHLVMGLPLTMFSLFGIVALSGVVVNDSIVLIDFINHRLREGLPVTEALVDAGRQRFRPVLLTSITTVVGLLPIVLETSMQAQVLIPMAVSLSFGLMLATVWVLLLVPCLFNVWARYCHLEADDEETADFKPDPVAAATIDE